MASPSTSESVPQLPPPPSPSADAGIAKVQGNEALHEDRGLIPDAADIDVFTLTPVAALKILCNMLEVLVRVTGDIPPTPPVSRPVTPKLDIVAAEKENAARHAEERKQKRRSRQWVGDDTDLPTKAKTPIGSPEARPTEDQIPIIDADIEPLISQHAAVARKFYSKKPPPISLEEYLMRLHKFCPMSTAVYLATSLYIHRLAVIDKTLPVTARNVHRLVLAGLRVAMKAVEDRSYAHSRFSKVGGVTEPELGRLEISFCFVTDFALRVTSEMLLEHAKTARDGSALSKMPNGFQPKLPLLQDKRNLVIGKPKPTAAAQAGTSAAG